MPLDTHNYLYVAFIILGAVLLAGFLKEMGKDLYQRFIRKNGNNLQTLCNDCKAWQEIAEIKNRQTSLREVRLPGLENSITEISGKIDSIKTKLDDVCDDIKKLFDIWDFSKNK